MDPHEVAPILGMTANGVAALSYRAREGLRKAWLQAHVNDESASGECRWTISRVGEHARRSLGSRDAERIADHLATCAKCTIINEEVDEVGSRLAMVMIPLILGGVVGGAFLSSFGTATGAIAATAIPALPAGIGAGTAVASSAGILGAATAPVAFIGTLAIAVAIGASGRGGGARCHRARDFTPGVGLGFSRGLDRVQVRRVAQHCAGGRPPRQHRSTGCRDRGRRGPGCRRRCVGGCGRWSSRPATRDHPVRRRFGQHHPPAVTACQEPP